ncbi:hypothetical protein GCM10022384_02570 [Streptomyces marokkonensis]|uniref:Uncharacterized protein n=1 Tax=Streptomyces marokkonensis TaxID=324855 RepID=A0ABP7NRG9_9ACTN
MSKNAPKAFGEPLEGFYGPPAAESMRLTAPQLLEWIMHAAAASTRHEGVARSVRRPPTAHRER